MSYPRGLCPEQYEQTGLRFLKDINTNTLLWAARSCVKMIRRKAKQPWVLSGLYPQKKREKKNNRERVEESHRIFQLPVSPALLYLPTAPANVLERARFRLRDLSVKNTWDSESPLTLKGQQR